MLSFLAFAVLLPTPLHAGKQKPDTQPPVKFGDQRQTAYFDITKIVWPNPPAIPRIAFKDLYTGQKIDPNLYTTKAHKQTWMDRLAGAQAADEIKVDKLPFQLIRTYGVGADSKGRIYAADQGVGAVFIFDPEKREHVELIGNGREANFGMIAGLALDDDDRLFVVDASLRRVVVFSPQHEQLAAFGADVLVRPASVAIDRQNRFVYVADTGNDVVDVFDADHYKFLRRIGKPSAKHDQTDPGTFSLPEGVAVDKDGNVYVTDTMNNRVEIFDADGKFISTFGKNGDGPGYFARPKGIAVDSDGHIWVADTVQNRLQVFNREGQLLTYIGGYGHYPGQFESIVGVAIDKNNRVFTSEQYPGRVQQYRYITDAEAEQLKKEKAAATGKTTAAASTQPTPPAAAAATTPQATPAAPVPAAADAKK